METSRILVVFPLLARRLSLDERAPPDLPDEQPLRLQKGQALAQGRAGQSQPFRQGAFRRQPFAIAEVCVGKPFLDQFSILVHSRRIASVGFLVIGFALKSRTWSKTNLVDMVLEVDIDRNHGKGYGFRPCSFGSRPGWLVEQVNPIKFVLLPGRSGSSLASSESIIPMLSAFLRRQDPTSSGRAISSVLDGSRVNSPPLSRAIAFER